MIKLDANESTLNLPATIMDAVQRELASVAFNRYPTDDQAGVLRTLIGAAYGLDANHVWLGNGSSEIIEKLCLGCRAIVYPEPSFSMYPAYAAAAGAESIPVPLDDRYDLDVERFVAAVNAHNADLAIVCNPNNPTGNLLSPAQIGYIAQHISAECTLLVDEAYIEFSDQPSSVSLLAKYPRMVVARTFSKALGLASIRLGYMLAAPVIVADTQRHYMPYHTNVLTLTVGRAAFAQRGLFAPRIQAAIAERERLYQALSVMPALTLYPSRTNFLLIESEQASALNDCLRQQGIAVRTFANNKRLRNSLRISVGTSVENDAAISVVKDFMGGLT